MTLEFVLLDNIRWSLWVYVTGEKWYKLSTTELLSHPVISDQQQLFTLNLPWLYLVPGISLNLMFVQINVLLVWNRLAFFLSTCERSKTDNGKTFKPPNTYPYPYRCGVNKTLSGPYRRCYRGHRGQGCHIGFPW